MEIFKLEIDRYGTKSAFVDAEKERERENVLVQSRSKLPKP